MSGATARASGEPGVVATSRAPVSASSPEGVSPCPSPTRASAAARTASGRPDASAAARASRRAVSAACTAARKRVGAGGAAGMRASSAATPDASAAAPAGVQLARRGRHHDASANVRVCPATASAPAPTVSGSPGAASAHQDADTRTVAGASSTSATARVISRPATSRLIVRANTECTAPVSGAPASRVASSASALRARGSDRTVPLCSVLRGGGENDERRAPRPGCPPSCGQRQIRRSPAAGPRRSGWGRRPCPCSCSTACASRP